MIEHLYKKIKYKLKYPDCNIMPNARLNGQVKIGAYTYIGYNTSITQTTIGLFCSIADDVTIAPGEHLVDKMSTSAFFYDNPWETLTQKECLIGNDVWIGTRSVILRGVHIGNGAIIGAGSIITKDVPAYGIMVGVPGRLLRKRFDEEKIKKIEELKWWNQELSNARKTLSQLENIL